MSPADASSLNLWSWIYLAGMWFVAIGVAMESAEILARRAEKKKRSRFIGPLREPFPEPITPKWAHTVGDIGFLILVSSLVLENVAHSRMEQITEREQRRLIEQLNSTTRRAGEANERAGLADKLAAEANERSKQLESTNLLLRSSLLTLEARMRDRTITPEIHAKLVQCLRLGPIGPVTILHESFGSRSAEAKGYTEDILSVLREVRFLGVRSNKFNIVALDVPGVFLHVKDPTNPPPHALSIQTCFQANGILPAEMRRYDFTETNVVGIFVSGKP